MNTFSNLNGNIPIDGSNIINPSVGPSTFQYKESGENHFQYGMVCQRHEPPVKVGDAPFYYMTLNGHGVCRYYFTRPYIYREMLLDPIRTMEEDGVLKDITYFQWIYNNHNCLDWAGNSTIEEI